MAGLFANSISAVERMMRALEFNLKGITRANGYNTDIGDIFFEIPEQADIVNRPAIALLRGQTVIENQDQSDQEWHKLIPFTALVYLESQDPTWARTRVLQDLEKMIGVKNMLPDEAGVETCREVTLDGDRPFSMVLNKPHVGFVFAFSVRLAQSIPDPSVAS